MTAELLKYSDSQVTFYAHVFDISMIYLEFDIN